MSDLLSRNDVIKLSGENYPLLVLSDNLRSLFSWRTKVHSDGFYNHVMWLWNPQRVAGQNFKGFEDVNIRTYLDGKFRMKFWGNPHWSPKQLVMVRNRIQEILALPLKQRRYDWLGIVGQLLGLNWLQDSSRYYCSEVAGEILGLLEPFSAAQPSPADLNQWCKNSPTMMCLGVYDPDMSGD